MPRLVPNARQSVVRWVAWLCIVSLAASALYGRAVPTWANKGAPAEAAALHDDLAAAGAVVDGHRTTYDETGGAPPDNGEKRMGVLASPPTPEPTLAMSPAPTTQTPMPSQLNYAKEGLQPHHTTVQDGFDVGGPERRLRGFHHDVTTPLPAYDTYEAHNDSAVIRALHSAFFNYRRVLHPSGVLADDGFGDDSPQNNRRRLRNAPARHKESPTVATPRPEVPRDRDTSWVVPVYGTACVAFSDCQYVTAQLLSFRANAVGHVILVVSGRFEHPNASLPTLFRDLKQLFPSQFTLVEQPESTFSCAESWNIIQTMAFEGFSPQPHWAWIANADLYVKGDYMKRFATYTEQNWQKVVAVKFVDFSSFAVTLRGWRELGLFDEAIYPAYAEDVEWHLRAVSKQLAVGKFPATGRDSDRFHHTGSRTLVSKLLGERRARWNPEEYIFRKWGVRLYRYKDFALAKPFSTPFKMRIRHNESFVVDPVHRLCILTGTGPRYTGGNFCKKGRCDFCRYNLDLVKSLLTQPSANATLDAPTTPRPPVESTRRTRRVMKP